MKSLEKLVMGTVKGRVRKVGGGGVEESIAQAIANRENQTPKSLIRDENGRDITGFNSLEEKQGAIRSYHDAKRQNALRQVMESNLIKPRAFTPQASTASVGTQTPDTFDDSEGEEGFKRGGKVKK